MRMSKTFAVSTYSGGFLRMDSIWTVPAFRSFLSLRPLHADLVRPAESLHSLVQ